MPDAPMQETTPESTQGKLLPATTDQAVDLARRYIYEFLAAALSDPVRKHFETALDRKVHGIAVAGADLVASETPPKTELAPGEHAPSQLDLRRMVEAIERPRGDLIAQHQRLFGLLIAKTAPPYETEYCRSTLTFYRSQQLADIAGFYRAFGLEQSRDEPERQDHIAVELEFMAHLIERQRSAASTPELQEKAALCREAQRKFFEAHLAWWAPAFAELMARGTPDGLYPAIAGALASFVACERNILGIQPASALAEPKPEPEPAAENLCCGPMPCE